MSKIYSVEALILRARDYGEADKILTLYTREQGKVSAIAKGVRKPKSRLRGGVQPFSHSRVLLYRGPSLDTVTQAEAVQAFAPLREDLTFLSYASYLVELLECAVPEREPHEGIFRLAVNCLELFPEGDPELVARLFEMRLIYYLGYQPYLIGCMKCGGTLEAGPFYLDPGIGGLVCRKCSLDPHGKTRVTAGTASTLNGLLSLDKKSLFRLKISSGTRREMDAALRSYLEYYLARKLKSRRVL
ncbi:MAG: DNA repair protein RecO, partial [Desulfitobacteriaceae bacterium]|nr:DNA repair protein RecO [Desulfitobacteriaceae bacterium]